MTDTRPNPALLDSPLAERLLELFRTPTGLSSAGYPYFSPTAWERFRDRIPHLFCRGLQVYGTVEAIDEAAEAGRFSETYRHDIHQACGVARQVLKTAAITAPPDLWVMRHVLGYFHELGLAERLLGGEALYPQACQVDIDGESVELNGAELERDLHFLLARGMVEQYDDSFRIAGHPRVRRIFEQIGPLGDEVPVPMTPVWEGLFSGDVVSEAERAAILDLEATLPTGRPGAQNHWIASRVEIEIGYRLLPVVLGLRASERLGAVDDSTLLEPSNWAPADPRLCLAALRILRAAGWVEPDSDGHDADDADDGGDNEYERFRVTALGARGLQRGPGPFGIIEAYHAYLDHGKSLLTDRDTDVWVNRSDNVAASRDANAKTFRRANDSLDRFCRDTDFDYDVFIEHAIGHGEATRQRFARSGDADIRYFGADLEDPAIDAALRRQRRGELPPEMVFVRGADIGRPPALLDALRDHGADPHGAVMMVGNGFHEVRRDPDGEAEDVADNMADVFRQYHEAGILLLFTEANALTIDDLRATAWNTYHAGFTLMHEKSGQRLRPSTPRPRPRLGRPLRDAWSTCAARAGYVRAADYCTRSRTIYPHARPDGHNPSLSVNHFFVPADIAHALGLEG